MVKRRKAVGTAGAGGGARSKAKPSGGSHLSRGAQARAKAKQVAEDAGKEGNDPWRFWLKNSKELDPKTASEDFPAGMPKNECEIIILDNSLDDIIGMYEHNLKIGGKWGNHEGCCKEFDNCPLCDGGDKSYYVLFFSILALRPWSSKDGKKSGGWTRMLYPVKSTQMAEFEELCQSAQDSHAGVLRGTYMHLKRDVTNSQSPSIGKASLLEGGVVYDYYTAEELESEFGNAEERSPEGKVLKEANADITAFDYDELFSKPDGDSLRAQYAGGQAQAGSQADIAKEWQEPNAEAGAEAPRTAPSRRRRVTPTTTDATPEPFDT